MAMAIVVRTASPDWLVGRPIGASLSIPPTLAPFMGLSAQRKNGGGNEQPGRFPRSMPCKVNNCVKDAREAHQRAEAGAYQKTLIFQIKEALYLSRPSRALQSSSRLLTQTDAAFPAPCAISSGTATERKSVTA